MSLQASEARLASARENLAMAALTLKTDTDRAKASLESAEVAANDASAKAERMKLLYDKKLASREDCDTAETAASVAQTSLESCKIKLEELKTQERGLEVQRQNVKLAEGQVESDKIALEIAEAAAADCIVKAPMDGVVTARTIQQGTIIASAVSNVAGGTTILTLSDLSRIFVLASVDESDIGKIEVGQTATITADAYPTMQFAGKVVRIASKGLNTQNVVTFEVKIEVLGAYKHPDIGGKAKAPRGEQGARADKASATNKAPATNRADVPRLADRSAKAEMVDKAPASSPADGPGAGEIADKASKGDQNAILPEKKNLLKPEMTANIEITTADRKNALLIPVEAVSRLSGRFYANIPDTDETPQKKPIEIGISDSTNYELIAGLSEGDTVVVRKGMADSKWANNGQRPGQQGRPGQNNPARMMNVARGR